MNVKFRKMTACVLMLALMLTVVYSASFTAFAAEVPMPGSLIINGVSVTNSEEATAALTEVGGKRGSATLTHDSMSVTLTLTDATITAGENTLSQEGAGIYFYGNDPDTSDDVNVTFNLVLVGDNEVTAWSDASTSKKAINILECDFNILGSGSLIASASVDEMTYQESASAIVLVNGDLTINGPKVDLKVLAKERITYNYTLKTTGDISIINSVVNVYNNYGIVPNELSDNSIGIGTEGNDNVILIKNSTVNAYAGKSNGISCAIGGGLGVDIVIEDSTVKAVGGETTFGYSYGIASQNTGNSNGYNGGTVTITDSVVTAEGGKSVDKSYGIAGENGLEIINSKVYASGGEAELESYGLGAGYSYFDTNGNEIFYGDIIISGDSDVVATGNNAVNLSHGIGALNSVIIKDTSSVKAYAKATAIPNGYSFGIGARNSVILSMDSTLDLKGELLAIGSFGGWGFTASQSQNYILMGDGKSLTASSNMSQYKVKSLGLQQLFDVTFTGENVTSNGASKVNKGSDYVAVLTPAENYKIIPESIVVKVGPSSVVGFIFNDETGELTVPASLIRGTLSIEAAAEKITYPVLSDAKNSVFTGAQIAEKGSDYIATLKPNINYKISDDDIKVTVSGTPIDSFTYNEETGVLTIPAASVTGEVSIAVEAEIITFPVTFNSSTVTFTGENKAVAGSNYVVSISAPANHILPEGIIVKVGDTTITDYTYNSGGTTGKGSLTIPASVITDDVTVIVESKVKTYLVKFVDFDGKQIKTEVIEHGKDAIAPEAPVLSGYKFVGWDKEITNISADMVIKALYEVSSEVTNPDKEPTTGVTPEEVPQIEGSYAEKTGDTTNVFVLMLVFFTGSSALFVLKLTERKKKSQF